MPFHQNLQILMNIWNSAQGPITWNSQRCEGFTMQLYRYSNIKCIPSVIVGRSCRLLMVSWSWCMVLDTFFSFWIWIVIHFLINFSNVNDKLTTYQIQNELLYFLCVNSGRENGWERFRLLSSPISKPSTLRRRHLNPTILRIGAIP